jgi:hypothetical protein
MSKQSTIASECLESLDFSLGNPTTLRQLTKTTRGSRKDKLKDKIDNKIWSKTI